MPRRANDETSWTHSLDVIAAETRRRRRRRSHNRFQEIYLKTVIWQAKWIRRERRRRETKKRPVSGTGLDARYDDSLFLVQMTVFRRSNRHPFAPLAVFGLAHATDFLHDFLRGCFLLRHFLLGHCQISSMKVERYGLKVPRNAEICQQKTAGKTKINGSMIQPKHPRRFRSPVFPPPNPGKGPEKDLISGRIHRTFPPG